MVSRIQVDPKEFIKFVKENNKLDPYELGKKYNMSLSSMMRFLNKYGFIRIRTSEGMRYVLEAEIAPAKKDTAQQTPSDIKQEPKKDYSYDPNEPYDDMINYSFYSKDPIEKLRMNVSMRMVNLGKEFKELTKEVESKGYSDKISRDKKEKITIEVPSGFLASINSARFQAAGKLSVIKPVEQWTADECMKFMTVENWIIALAYKYSISSLLKEANSENMSVVLDAETHKKFSKHPAQG